MLNRTNIALVESPEWLGELHPLIEQLGSLDGLTALCSMSAALCLPRVDSRPNLECFLHAYQTRLLLPVELPAIQQAYWHTTRHEIRELMALDRQLAGVAGLEALASASRRVGRGQLARLRPLRDQRVVQRYLHAIEAGDAYGWHTLVYGVTLAIYSIPLRQGLLNYGRQTLRGFINCAAPALQISEEQSLDLLDKLSSAMPAAVEKLLVAGLANERSS